MLIVKDTVVFIQTLFKLYSNICNLTFHPNIYPDMLLAKTHDLSEEIHFSR